ncbi:serine hydrolase [Geosporobacter ferrireducens]|uniref:Beta-lactamase class A catalytic domain-containing protein n=1 Tax=Geosporobacter ferrireducens TaxID=1424294 RepID=A0A1D8GP08_9FIRM|nr:serine hydrolase [Geosporobacter ferrireducens]AOT72618.1 hypothetical protein Gferi_25525 [Geosporobacter ferrireducens]MTI55020.1 serine hydrolase [Geosporobacter ferrireducens]
MLEKEIIRALESTSAKTSVVLKDLRNDIWIFQKEEKMVIPSASTIKILIMTEALNQIQQGKYQLEEKVSIMEEEKVPYSIISDLTTDFYTFQDLITLMIIVSDNTATNVLIDLLGFDAINEMATKIGLKNTQLKRKMMDFEAAQMGRQNITTAIDMAMLMEKIFNREILNEKLCNHAIDILKRQKDKIMLKRYIPEDTVIAHKTGDLANLNHDIGIFYLPQQTYLLGVFVTEAQSNLAAQQIIGEISKLVYTYYL